MAKKKIKTRVVFISDTHFPYVNKESLKALYKVIEEVKPTHVIQAGDLLDFYSFSRYEKDANLTNPKSELEEGLEMANEMWANIKKIVPKSKCYQLIGNHEDRLSKTIAKKAPELSILCKTIQDLYDFKGVTVLDSSRDSLEIDNVIYTHGVYTKLGDHIKFYRKSVVHGHSHKPGICYEQVDQGTIWEMDCGFMADSRSLPLQYTQSSFSKWTQAVGVVENGMPRIILL